MLDDVVSAAFAFVIWSVWRLCNHKNAISLQTRAHGAVRLERHSKRERPIEHNWEAWYIRAWDSSSMQTLRGFGCDILFTASEFIYLVEFTMWLPISNHRVLCMRTYISAEINYSWQANFLRNVAFCFWFMFLYVTKIVSRFQVSRWNFAADKTKT